MQTKLAPAIANRRRGLVGLEQRVLAGWRAAGGEAGLPIVVGFSGGADSLALAAVLARLATSGGPLPVLLHVDHALRRESAAEADCAAALAAALGLPIQIRRLCRDPRQTHPGVGLEEAARRERYRAIAEAVAASGATAAALAHHQDDQAETVLLHLLRGAGLAGAAGMSSWSTLRLPWWDDPAVVASELRIWRPLIAEPKTKVRGYAQRLGLDPIADPSNDDRTLRRNALRHDIVPALNRIVPGATAALARFAGLAADEDAYLDGAAALIYARAVTETGDLARRPVAAQPVALRRRVVRHWLRQRAPGCAPTADRTEAVLALIEHGETGRRVEIGNNVTVRALAKVVRVDGGVSLDRDGERSA